VGELILLSPDEASAAGRLPTRKRRIGKGKPRKPNDYSKAERKVSVCLNCSTVCGIVGHVIGGKLVKVSGNPEDPNCGKTLCAKGQSGPTINDYPERVLFPLKRMGKRGEGLWKRVTWDEVIDETAKRIRKCIDDGKPEEVGLHVGRSRIGDIIGRFMNAVGSPVQLNHRALCSLAKRLGNYSTIGDTDWESVDAERTKFLLNFGSNFYESHQGHLGFLKRVIKGRYDNGAKLVTFDVRLSNTAGRSDEWFAPFPGTEGAIALAMGHAILKAGLHDRKFIDEWVNYPFDKLVEFYKGYTPEWAEKLSGISARDIERVALAFARCKPACAAFTNRGSHAHYNGMNNDRAVIMLNALVGSVGKPGGYCYQVGVLTGAKFPQPEPVPPKPKVRTDLEDPPEYPLANFWQKMRVGEIVFDFIKQKRALIQVYLSYTLGAPFTWPEGRGITVEVLKDETLVPFHACSDVVYSEMAHYADYILPDATYMERWGLDSRNNYELRPYTALRQPIVQPPGECRSYADVLIQIGKKLGPNAAKYFTFKDHEAFVRHQCKDIPRGDCKDGFDYMRKHGIWVDTSEPKQYELFRRKLKASALKGSRTDEKTGVVYRKNPMTGKEEAIGLKSGDVVFRGFKTPTRKFEVFSEPVRSSSARVKFKDDGLPHYSPVPAHENLPENRFILTTFKWNVHTQARTAAQKYLSEIVHDNPLWMNTATAKKLGIKNGDLVELTTFRPKGRTYRPTGEKLASGRIRVFVTEGIHPRVFAVSNSLGQRFGGRAAVADRAKRPDGPAYSLKLIPEDTDLSQTLWWDKDEGGKGQGVNLNMLMPIAPAPVTGMQSWFDTVCEIRKV
jgi:anaerobic selenocysteine-containing dehydrogenase